MNDELIKKAELKEFALEDEMLEDVAGGKGFLKKLSGSEDELDTAGQVVK